MTKTQKFLGNMLPVFFVWALKLKTRQLRYRQLRYRNDQHAIFTPNPTIDFTPAITKIMGFFSANEGYNFFQHSPSCY